jgi:hypothetical protein
MINEKQVAAQRLEPVSSPAWKGNVKHAGNNWTAQITLWRVIVAVIFIAGLYATYARFALGLGASTHLTDPQPWGLWVGLGTLCGGGVCRREVSQSLPQFTCWASNATARCCARP